MPTIWPYNSFPILSDSSSRNNRRRKRVSVLGGGYRQIAPDAINTLEVDGSFTVICHEDRPGQTYNDLEALLSIADGTETYEIQLPGKATKYWEVIDYTDTSVNDLVTNVTINVKSFNDASVFEQYPPGTKRLVYTPTWSSTLSAPVATYATLQDGSPSGHYSTTAVNQWLQADLGTAVNISHVGVQAGNVAGIGLTAALANGMDIQTSSNGTTWTTEQAITGLIDNGGKVIFALPVVVNLRYVRLFKASQIALSRFEVWGPV
jgi:phage-related protein